MSPEGSTAIRKQEFEWRSFANSSNEGDTNAQTGTIPDYVQDDNNIPEHSSLSYHVNKEHPHVTCLVNTQGRFLLDVCIALLRELPVKPSTTDQSQSKSIHKWFDSECKVQERRIHNAKKMYTGHLHIYTTISR